MPTIQFDFPPDVLSALRQSPEGFAKEMRLAAAIHWYSRGIVSQEKAAQIAGLHRIDFMKELAARKIDVMQVDMEDLQRELGRG